MPVSPKCINTLSCYYYYWASLVTQMVKNLPIMRETWVQSLGREEPLEKGMATHSSILAWRIPWMEATVHGVAKSWTKLSYQGGPYWKVLATNYKLLKIYILSPGLPGGSDR